MTDEFALESETVIPPLLAALERATVQVVDDPEATDDGEQPSDERIAGATSASVVEVDEPLRVAVI